MSDDPDPERFDGMTKTEALRLCVRRSFELSLSQVNFVNQMLAKKKPLRSDEVMRLRAIVVKMRQGDIEASLHTGDNAAA